MKNRIALKTFILVMAFSISAGFFASGCDSHKKTERQIATIREEAVTSYVNLPNPNGSVTPVRIIRKGNVYVGPRGEQYTSYPTVEQLRPVYGNVR